MKNQQTLGTSDPPFQIGQKVTWHTMVNPTLTKKNGYGPFVVTKVFQYQDDPKRTRRPKDLPSPVWMIQIEKEDGTIIFFERPRYYPNTSYASHDPFRDFAASNFVDANSSELLTPARRIILLMILARTKTQNSDKV
jgi:hypothetical protein